MTVTPGHKPDKSYQEFVVQSESIRGNSIFSPDADGAHICRDLLKRYWDQTVLILDHQVDAILCDAWFDKIYQQHNEDGRFYHTSVHLKEILEYWYIIIQLSDQPPSLQPFDKGYFTIIIVWATFFHDAVYNPRSTQNERESANLFKDFSKQVLGLNFDEPIIEKDDIKGILGVAKLVISLIHATEKHQIITTASMTATEIELQKFFLDLDMAVLGKKKEAYLAYAGLIRKEYAFIDLSIYCEKRAEILSGFLKNQKRIFLSDLFHHHMEVQARNNLKDEIELLKRGIVPEGKCSS
jgi:predicted metal-dependent HD superfamily phosphohydrolase